VVWILCGSYGTCVSRAQHQVVGTWNRIVSTRLVSSGGVILSQLSVLAIDLWYSRAIVMSRSLAVIALVLTVYLSLALSIVCADPGTGIGNATPPNSVRNSVESQYRAWAASNEKSHADGSIEYDLAFVAFQHTLNTIAKFNETAAGYSIGLTITADETPEQINKRRGINPDEVPEPGTYSVVNGVRVPGIVHASAEAHHVLGTTPTPTPTKIAKPAACTAMNSTVAQPGVVCDWRLASVNVVSPVRNQGQCGSCWAFAANGATESALRIKNVITTQQSLSDQQVTSCSAAYGNQGCNGGWPTQAWAYIQAINGETSNTKYSYTSGGGQTGTCKYSTTMAISGIKVTGYVSLSTEDQLMNAINNVGPTVVAIDAGLSTFSYYKSGVYSDPSCGGTRGVDHAVLVIGYGTETTGQKYWLIKNQWGTTWGMSGFMKMERGVNRCNIGRYPQYVLV